MPLLIDPAQIKSGLLKKEKSALASPYGIWHVRIIRSPPLPSVISLLSSESLRASWLNFHGDFTDSIEGEFTVTAPVTEKGGVYGTGDRISGCSFGFSNSIDIVLICESIGLSPSDSKYWVRRSDPILSLLSIIIVKYNIKENLPKKTF